MDGTEDFAGRPHLVKQRARVIAMQRVLIALSLLLAVAMIGLIVWDIREGRERSKHIVDCTTPGGECYRQGQARTEIAVSEIINRQLIESATTRRVVVLAAYCAAEPGNDAPDDIQRCIETEMERK